VSIDGRDVTQEAYLEPGVSSRIALLRACGGTQPACSPLRQRLIPRSSRTRPPEAPAGSRESTQDEALKLLLTAGIPAYSRSARKRRDRPVTPEVAGSSPVAPVENILEIRIFCCLPESKRPPVSADHAHIPHEM
jgi:hypothetical protein